MGLQLRKYREAAGLTMREAAQRLCVAGPSYCNWETGKTLPTADKLPAIAALFRCSIDELFGDGQSSPNATILPPEGGQYHGA